MKTLLLIEREVRERVLTKSFIWATILTPAFLLGVMLLPRYFDKMQQTTLQKFAVIDQSGMGMLDRLIEEMNFDQVLEEEGKEVKERRSKLEATGAEAEDVSSPAATEDDPTSIPEMAKKPKGPILFQMIKVEADPKAPKPKTLAEQYPLISGITRLANRRDVDDLLPIKHVWDPAPQELRDRVLSGEIAGYLVFPPNFKNDHYFHYFAKTTGDSDTLRKFWGTVTNIVRRIRLENEGIGGDKLAGLLAPLRLDARSIGRTEVKGANPMPAIVAMMMLYFTIIIYGATIMNSMLEEKQSRVLEVMLATVSARQLLMSKVFGVGISGLLQYLIWYASFRVAYIVFPVLGSSDTAKVSNELLLVMIGAFVVGYLIYATCYAVLGVIAESSQDAQSLQWVLVMFLMVPLVGMVSIIKWPESMFSQILTWFPMTAPLMVPMRVALAPMGMGQIAAIGAVGLAFACLVIWLSGRLFRATVLMTGKRPSFMQMVKLTLVQQ